MKEFKVAEVVPVEQLEDIKNNFYHICYASIAEIEQYNDGRNLYTEFYKKMSDKYKYVLMNCAGMTFKGITEQYININPAEIIIPYTKDNTNRTISDMFDFIKLTEFKCRHMAVPQGDSFESWKACAYIMMKEDRINTIGINGDLCKITGDKFSCIQAVWYLDEIAYKLGRDDIEYHLFGFNLGSKIINDIRRTGKRVRGCSSMFPYKASELGIVIDGGTVLDRCYIDILNGRRLDNFIINSRTFEVCSGVIDNVSDTWS